MRTPTRLTALGGVAGLAGAVAALAIGGAAPGVADTSGKVYTATTDLSCVLAPGVLNVAGTVSATIQGTAPATAHPGDRFNLTNVTTTLRAPANWATSFSSLGATSTSGSVTNFVLDGAGASPATLNAGAAMGSGGLPFGPVPVTSGQALDLRVPSSGSFTVGEYTVTANAGGTVTLSIDPAAGFTGTRAPYRVTGQGIVANATGYDSSGQSVVGPVSIVCNPPSTPVVLGSVPVTAGGGTTTTTTTPTTTTPTTTTRTTPTTTTPTRTTPTPPPAHTIIKFNQWNLSGSLTPRRLNQQIALPSGSRFNGAADLTDGTLTGDISVPAFSTTIKVLGIPTRVSVTFTQASPVTGRIGPDPADQSKLLVNGVAKAYIGINGVGLGFLNLPTSCQTTSPVSFPLNASQPALALTQGASFSGTTTLPTMSCSGPFGFAVGPLLTGLFSGSNNPYQLAIAPATR